jgi:hypothetical protein
MSGIALAAVICGGQLCVDFAGPAGKRKELAQDFPGLENDLPGHDALIP